MKVERSRNCNLTAALRLNSLAILAISAMIRLPWETSPWWLLAISKVKRLLKSNLLVSRNMALFSGIYTVTRTPNNHKTLHYCYLFGKGETSLIQNDTEMRWRSHAK